MAPCKARTHSPLYHPGPPEEFESAEEYLQWVRYEASRCPQTHRVEVQLTVAKAEEDASTSNPSSSLSPLCRLMRGRDVPKGPDWCQPKREWVRAFVVQFRSLRAKISGFLAEGGSMLVTLPHSRDKKEWERLCFGPSGDQEASSEPLIKESAEQEPKLMTLLSMDQVCIVSVLSWIVEGLDGSKITEKRARWIFSLSAVLEKPIHAETAAMFRGLFRKCSVMRADLTSGPEDPLLPLLNMLAAISGGYFGQDESLCRMLNGMGLANEEDLA